MAHKNKELQQAYNRENGLPVTGDDSVVSSAQNSAVAATDDIQITDEDREISCNYLWE